MKAYTDIEQSKKLTDILPTESADMHYIRHSLENFYSPTPIIGKYSKIQNEIPCWSTNSLLNILREKCNRLEIASRVNNKWNIFATKFDFTYNNWCDGGCENLIDGCVEIIVKLKESKLL